jgi:hypothetical protein
MKNAKREFATLATFALNPLGIADRAFGTEHAHIRDLRH